MDSNIWVECKQDVMRGKPCIKGTRITVESILEMLGSGMSYVEIISDFPSLDETICKIIAATATGYNPHHSNESRLFQ